MSFTTFLARGLRIQVHKPFSLPSSVILHTRYKLYSSSTLTRSTVKNWTAASRLFKATGIATGIGLGLTNFIPRVYCDSTAVNPSSHDITPDLPPPPPPPASTVSLYELSFGTVTGICAGIFIKKGAKAVAWLLGGVFVLLQYLGSASLVRVDWGRMATKFQGMFYETDATGTKKAPTVISIWTWLVEFLTADFQPRASFLAGLMLGLRIG